MILAVQLALYFIVWNIDLKDERIVLDYRDQQEILIG